MSLKVTKRPKTPHWVIRGTVTGRRIEKSTGTTDRNRAEAMRIKLEGELLDRYTFGDGYVATFAEAVNRYLDDGKDSRFLCPLLDRFGDWPLVKIKTTHVKDAAQEIYPNASAATRNRQVLTPMSAIINYAADHELCNHIRLRRYKESKVERCAVSREWLDAVMLQCPENLATMLMFMTLTGSRVGDACALRWKDVNLVNGFVTLPWPKSGTPERVALSAPLIAAMANLSIPRRDPVFGYAHRWSVYGTLRRACKRANVDYHTPHEIGRHTFATWLLEQGHSLKFVMEAGRWASTRLVGEVYGHIERSHVDDGVRALGESWGSKSSGINNNQN